MPTIRFCAATDGKRLAYATDGDGPALVFPAWWVSHIEKDWEHDRFREFFSALAESHLVVRYDRVGVGLSDRKREEDDLTVDREVEDLGSIIDHLGLTEVSLFGVSCGGPIAITYAHRQPERVRSLVMHGSFLQGCGLGTSEIRQAMLALVQASWGFGSKTLASMFTPELSYEELQRIARMQRGSAEPEMAARLMALTFSLDVKGLAPGVPTPCLVLHRNDDTTIPFAAGRELAAHLPDASFVPLRGTAHPPWEGDSKTLLGHVLSFLGTQPRDRGAVLPVAGRPDQNALVRRGDIWTLSFGDAEVHLKHSKGLADLAALLTRPGEEIAAGTLMHGAAEPAVRGTSDEILDERARREFRSRVDAIEEDLEEARSFHDLGRIARLEEEREAILSELSAATGLGGRSRKLKDPGERARKAVSARIRESIQRIAEAHPTAGDHFEKAVRPGSFCCYDPRTPTSWRL